MNKPPLFTPSFLSEEFCFMIEEFEQDEFKQDEFEVEHIPDNQNDI